MSLIDKPTFELATETFGREFQILLAIEEMSELTKELIKSLRGRDNNKEIAEEISDVIMLMEQMKLIFGIDDEDVNAVISFKTERLKSRLALLIKDRE